MNTEAFHAGCPWYDEIQKFGEPNIKWCEERVCALINEPNNAWSNLAYIAVALLLFTRSKKSGTLVLLMGLGSFIFHATNFYLTQILDFLGMFLVLSFLMTMNLTRLGWIKKNRFNLTYFSLILGMTATMHLMRVLELRYQLIVGASVLFIVWTEFRCKDRYHTRSLPVAMGFFVLGTIAQWLDSSRAVCDPHSIFLQGHAYWHVFSALATGFVFLHYERLLNSVKFR